MSGHQCHANGCREEAAVRPEIPFCQKHWRALPEPLRAKLWKRREKGACGLCYPSDRGWGPLANHAIALLSRLDHGDYECEPGCIDEDGFCWDCGVHDAKRTYRSVAAAIKKFNLGGEDAAKRVRSAAY